MAKLLKMLWEYMDLTVLPFFETWSAHIFGGWQRVCWCTNEAFNQASPTKEFWENCPQKKGGHIYGKNEGWAYLRKLLYPIFSFTAKGYSVSSLSFQDQTFHFSKRIPLFHNPTKNKKFATGRYSAQVFNFCALLDRIDLCLIPTWLPHFVPSLQRAGEGALGYKSWCKK